MHGMTLHCNILLYISDLFLRSTINTWPVRGSEKLILKFTHFDLTPFISMGFNYTKNVSVLGIYSNK